MDPLHYWAESLARVAPSQPPSPFPTLRTVTFDESDLAPRKRNSGLMESPALPGEAKRPCGGPRVITHPPPGAPAGRIVSISPVPKEGPQDSPVSVMATLDSRGPVLAAPSPRRRSVRPGVPIPRAEVGGFSLASFSRFSAVSSTRVEGR